MNTAIIIGDDHYNTLGVIRSLGEMQVNIILIVTTKGKTFVEKSKYISKVIKVNKDESEILTQLNKCISELDDSPVLFPLSDYSAKVLDDNYYYLRNKSSIPNAKGNLNIYLNKKIMSDLASKVGLDVPTNLVLKLNENYEKLILQVVYPAIIKPLVSINGFKSDIRIISDEDQLKKELKNLELKGYSEVLVEKYICGMNDYMIEVLGYVGESIDDFNISIIKKIREYPINRGSTSYAKVLKEHEAINLAAIKKLVKKIDYVGIFDIEFKFCSGTAYFIEINFRNGAPSYALTKLEKNIPFLWYCSVLNNNFNNDISSKKIKNRSIFMCEQTDVLNMIKGEVTFLKWVREYINSTKIFFNINDIKPVWVYYVKMIWNWINIRVAHRH